MKSFPVNSEDGKLLYYEHELSDIERTYQIMFDRFLDDGSGVLDAVRKVEFMAECRNVKLDPKFVEYLRS